MRKTRVAALLSLLVVLAVVAGLMATGCGSSGSTSSSGSSAPAGPIKIGLVVSQTGVSAVVGKNFLTGTQLAVDQINAAGGINGSKIELIVKDDGSDVPKAIAAVNQLIQQDKVNALLGPSTQFIAPAARKVAEKAQVPMLQTSSPPLDDPSTYKWTFSTMQGPGVNGAATIAMMTEQENTASTLWLGPFAMQIVNQSPIPVLSIHPKDVYTAAGF